MTVHFENKQKIIICVKQNSDSKIDDFDSNEAIHCNETRIQSECRNRQASKFEVNR